MIPLPLALRLYDCSRNKLNKWRAAGHLSNDIPTGSAGVKTMISREAALEIGFMSAATAVGYEPADAKVIVKGLLIQATRGGPVDPFWVSTTGGFFRDSRRGNKTLADLAGNHDQAYMPSGAEHRPAMGIRAINAGEIIARLDAWERVLAEDAGE